MTSKKSLTPLALQSGGAARSMSTCSCGSLSVDFPGASRRHCSVLRTDAGCALSGGVRNGSVAPPDGPITPRLLECKKKLGTATSHVPESGGTNANVDGNESANITTSPGSPAIVSEVELASDTRREAERVRALPAKLTTTPGPPIATPAMP
jgi:hypothetical protein